MALVDRHRRISRGNSRTPEISLCGIRDNERRISVKRFIERQPTFQTIHGVLPDDHSRQVTAEVSARAVLRGMTGASRILDLGCGSGDSVEFFKAIKPDAEWFGVDIEDSPEVRTRIRADDNISTFDGIRLPYEDETFDVVYSHQVFEHVRHPDALMREVARVLKSGGVFVGSVSYLEPFHSFSIFNFTPYGVIRCCEDAGLEIKELRPGIAAFTLILRQALNRPRFFEYFLRVVSPFNCVISLLGWIARIGHRHRNFLKLQFTGQICFVATKAQAGQATGSEG